MAMSMQIAQTKYHCQVPLHDTEIIIPARDTIPDLHLTITTGTDTGLTDQGHIPAVTDTEVTARAIRKEVTPGHITDIHTGAHLATDTQPHIIIDGIHHTGDLHHTEALPHILVIAVGQDHVTHTELPVWHPPNPPTALAGQPGKNKDKKYKQVTIDDLPSDYYSSDEPSSESDEDLNSVSPLLLMHPTNGEGHPQQRLLQWHTLQIAQP